MKHLNIYLTLFLAALLCSISAAQPVDNIRCVKYSDLSNASMVGEDGVILNTTDNGKNWTEQTSGITNVLFGFSSLDVNTSFAVGENGIILKSADAGLTWRIIISGFMENLIDVNVVNTNYIIACGENGTIIVSSNMGNTWSQKITGVPDNLNHVHFIDENTGFIVGNNSAFFKTTNKGEDWTKIEPFFEPINIKAIYARDENVLTIVGENGLILNSNDGGQSWIKPISNSLNSELNDIFLLGTKEGVIAGNDGIVLKTIDCGLTWYLVSPKLPTPYNFLSVSFSSHTNGILLCENGTVYYTSDGGETWTERSKPAISKMEKKILALNYPNPFNPTTKISFELPKAGNLVVSVFDITGKEVTRLFEGYSLSGTQEFTFNASNLSSGVYFYTIRAEGLRTVTNKMILTK